MAEAEGDIESSSRYVSPAIKSVEEIINLDNEDESLKKYKQTLLGGMGDCMC